MHGLGWGRCGAATPPHNPARPDPICAPTTTPPLLYDLRSQLNPHRTLLGNYDVNTVEVALRRRGKELRWHDVRDASFARLDLQAPGLQGLILNVQASGVAWLAGWRRAG